MNGFMPHKCRSQGCGLCTSQLKGLDLALGTVPTTFIASQARQIALVTVLVSAHSTGCDGTAQFHSLVSWPGPLVSVSGRVIDQFPGDYSEAKACEFFSCREILLIATMECELLYRF